MEPQGLQELLGDEYAPSTVPAQANPQVPNQTPSMSEPEGLSDLLGEDYQAPAPESRIEQGKAFLEGAGQGLAGPAAPVAEQALSQALFNQTPEETSKNILARQAQFPLTHVAGEAVGLIAPAIATNGISLEGRLGAEALSQAGAIKALTEYFPKAQTLAGKIGTGAAKQAFELGTLSTNDELSQMILQDPEQSSQTALAHVGLNAAIGGVLGGVSGAIGKAFESASKAPLSSITSDFKNRILENIENPDPISNMTKEMQSLSDSMKDVPVYGAGGIKDTIIRQTLPETITPEIDNQLADIHGELKSSLDSLISKGDPLAGALSDTITKWSGSLNDTIARDPYQLFNKIQELKQTLQQDAKYIQGFTPIAEKAYRSTVKDLASYLRVSLEDSDVWGKAGDVQHDINSAFTNLKPAQDDIRKLFFKDVAGDETVDPGKISTYINNLGKPNNEIKQTMVRNIIDSTQDYQNIVNKAYQNIGAESPFKDIPLTTTLSTLQKQTVGTKLADVFTKKILSEAASKGLGGIVGYQVGKQFDMPEVGAAIGTFGLGPMIGRVLPILAKSILSSDVSQKGLISGSNFINAVVKGQKLVSDGAKGVFQSGSLALSKNIAPSTDHLNKLDDKLKDLQTNSNPLLKNETSLSHYMPSHAITASQSTAQAVSYLNSLRAGEDKPGVLDPPRIPSSTQKAKFRSALEIGQQPLTVFNKIKAGTLTQDDITAIRTMYPGLYKNMAKQLTNEMIEAVHKGVAIPYSTRLALSAFLGQPLDSTMSPQAITAAQINLMPQSSGPVAFNASGTQAKGVKSSPALQKMSSLSWSPAQARSLRMNNNR